MKPRLILKKSSKDNDLNNKHNANNNTFCETKTMEKLIVVDDVSCLADKLPQFSSYLTVARKFGYSCIYIFYVIYPEKANWKKILWQAKFFNNSSDSVEQSSVLKIISSNCSRETVSYIPNIDCQQNIPNGPGKFREQKKTKDRTYITFFSKIIPHSDENLFQIESVFGKTKKEKEETFDANLELKDLIENNERGSIKRTLGKTNSKITKFTGGKIRTMFQEQDFLLDNEAPKKGK